MNNIKISVIIPIYNTEKYISTCLESVVNQTLREIEIICIDDGSTDRSLEIIDTYKKNTSNIRILRQNHSGSGQARNWGIREASGKYVAFLDSDDWYGSCDVLQKLYCGAEDNNVMISGGFPRKFTANGELIKKYKYPAPKEGMNAYSDFQYHAGYTNYIYNREMLLHKKITFPDLKRYQDAVFFVKAMLASGYFYYIPENVTCVRVIPKEFSPNQMVDMMNGMKELLKVSRENKLLILHRNVLNQIENDISYCLSKEMLCDPKVIDLLKELNTSLDRSLLSLSEDYVIKPLAYMVDYPNIISSYSYRLGRILTYIPRKILKANNQ